MCHTVHTVHNYWIAQGSADVMPANVGAARVEHAVSIVDRDEAMVSTQWTSRRYTHR
jgi:hypothetical protein